LAAQAVGAGAFATASVARMKVTVVVRRGPTANGSIVPLTSGPHPGGTGGTPENTGIIGRPDVGTPPPAGHPDGGTPVAQPTHQALQSKTQPPLSVAEIRDQLPEEALGGKANEIPEEVGLLARSVAKLERRLNRLEADRGLPAEMDSPEPKAVDRQEALQEPKPEEVAVAAQQPMVTAAVSKEVAEAVNRLAEAKVFCEEAEEARLAAEEALRFERDWRRSEMQHAADLATQVSELGRQLALVQHASAGLSTGTSPAKGLSAEVSAARGLSADATAAEDLSAEAAVAKCSNDSMTGKDVEKPCNRTPERKSPLGKVEPTSRTPSVVIPAAQSGTTSDTDSRVEAGGASAPPLILRPPRRFGLQAEDDGKADESPTSQGRKRSPTRIVRAISQPQPASATWTAVATRSPQPHVLRSPTQPKEQPLQQPSGTTTAGSSGIQTSMQAAWPLSCPKKLGREERLLVSPRPNNAQELQLQHWHSFSMPVSQSVQAPPAQPLQSCLGTDVSQNHLWKANVVVAAGQPQVSPKLVSPKLVCRTISGNRVLRSRLSIAVPAAPAQTPSSVVTPVTPAPAGAPPVATAAASPPRTCAPMAPGSGSAVWVSPRRQPLRQTVTRPMLNPRGRASTGSSMQQVSVSPPAHGVLPMATDTSRPGPAMPASEQALLVGMSRGRPAAISPQATRHIGTTSLSPALPVRSAALGAVRGNSTAVACQVHFPITRAMTIH